MRMVRDPVSNSPDARQSIGVGVSSPDYIRVYLGLMGSGKTTAALQALTGSERAIVFSPGSTNEWMRKFPYIYDTPEYEKDFDEWFRRYPIFRIERRSALTGVFRWLGSGRVRGCSILLDDIATLKTNAVERADFESFLRSIRFYGNRLVVTTHRLRKDLPPVVHLIATSIYYVGPCYNGKEIDALYELTNLPLSHLAFEEGLKNNASRIGSHAAGIFAVKTP